MVIMSLMWFVAVGVLFSILYILLGFTGWDD